MSTSIDSHFDAGDKLVIPARVTLASRHRRVLWLGGAASVVVAAGIWWALLIHPAATTYRTEPLRRRTISRTVEALGHLDVPQRVEVSAPGPGRLARILVEPGQSVRRGQLLAELDHAEAELALGAARGSLKVGESRIAEAQVTLEAAIDVGARTERLASRGLASEADLRAAKAAETRARAALQGARAERAVTAGTVTSAALQKELTAIRAPSDGIILAAPDRVGAAVSLERGRLFVLGNTLAVMHIKAAIAEADVAEVKPGQSAHFTVPAFPGRAFDARVLRVDPDAERERSSVTYEVTLEADNRPQLLFPGMTASVYIDVARADDVLAVRAAALRFVPTRVDVATDEENHRSRIWRLRPGNRIEPLAVTPGMSDGAFTEVRVPPGENVQVGDAIVIGLLLPDHPRGAGPGVTLGTR